MHMRIRVKGKIHHKSPSGIPVPVTLYAVDYFDTKKNHSYIKKRKELGERATKELGVTCFG